MSIVSNLGKRIRVLLAARDVGQKEFAARTGMNADALSTLLSGQVGDLSVSTLEAIASALGCALRVEIEEETEGLW